MIKENEKKHGSCARRKDVRLWLGLLMAPAAWAVQLQTVYLLIEHGCGTGDFAAVHVVSVIALAVSIAGTVISWHEWQTSGGQFKNEEEGILPRSRFMAIVGMLLGTLLSVLIFAQWLPVIMGVPCRT